jgi:hypothetical protein
MSHNIWRRITNLVNRRVPGAIDISDFGASFLVDPLGLLLSIQHKLIPKAMGHGSTNLFWNFSQASS